MSPPSDDCSNRCVSISLALEWRETGVEIVQSENQRRSPLCGVAEAIRILARQPREAPADPCQDLFDVLPQHQPSRWLLSYLPALRVLVGWTGDGEPPAPDGWRELEPRLGLRPVESLWPFDVDEIWRSRVDTMRAHCASSGLSPATWLARWVPYELAAKAHLEAFEQRNAATLDAALNLRVITAGAGGPAMFGRDIRTGRTSKIPRALHFDPSAAWPTDRNARFNAGLVVFTGAVRTSTAEYTDVSFAANDIEALLSGALAPISAPADRSQAAAVRRAAVIEFPAGPPAGMRAAARDARIAARVVQMGGAKPSERTIREGIRGLWPRGVRGRRT